jgi:hypothetical protein
VADKRIPYKAFSPPNPATAAFDTLLPDGAGEVEVIEDADPHTVIAVIEAAVNEQGHAAPGAQVRLEVDFDGTIWVHHYDAPEA